MSVIIPCSIIDHKTSSRIISPNEYAWSAQTFFYIIAGKFLYGEILPMTYVVCYVAGAKSGIKLFEVRKTEQQLNDYLNSLYALWLRLQEGIVNPRKTFRCGWCGYKEECAELTIK